MIWSSHQRCSCIFIIQVALMREAISWYSSRLNIDPRYLNRPVPGRSLSMTMIVTISLKSILKKLFYSVSDPVVWGDLLDKLFNISFDYDALSIHYQCRDQKAFQDLCHIGALPMQKKTSPWNVLQIIKGVVSRTLNSGHQVCSVLIYFVPRFRSCLFYDTTGAKFMIRM